MKEYKKPAMLALSISANDMLCSGCADHKLRDDVTFRGIMAGEGYDSNNNGTLDKEEYANLFAEADGASTSPCAKVIKYEEYCKFTGTYMVAWS